MSVLRAKYFDGQRSLRHDVSVIIAAGQLSVVGRDVNAKFDARGVRRSLRITNTPRWLYLPGGGACVTEDNDAVDRATREVRYDRLLQKWEARPIYAVLAVALVLVSAWLLIDKALPLAIEQIAMRIPVEAEKQLGSQTLAGMDGFMLRSSQIPTARQDSLRSRLAAMARTAGEDTAYQIEFRSSPFIGANAIALPGGTIVVTDALIRLAKRDEEILAVLAHEIGHEKHRHTMRRLLESSATALVIAALTGDVSSAMSMAASAPTVLVQSKYSRDSEREADAYAIEFMRKNGLSAGHLANILRRMESTDQRGGPPTLLSSHPATKERMAVMLAAGGAVTEIPDAESFIGKNLNLLAVDPLQRSVVGLVDKRDYSRLENLLADVQRQFNQDSSRNEQLENAFGAFRSLPASSESALSDWVTKMPRSYSASLGRGIFLLEFASAIRRKDQELGDEGRKAVQENLNRARKDFEQSLTLAEKPYLSRLMLMELSRISANRATGTPHFQAALLLAPQSISLRLEHMSSLEPRWGGSYAEMESYLTESRVQVLDAKGVDRLAARIPAYRGWEHQRDKKFAQALSDYDAALRLYPEGVVLCERSFVLTALDRHAEAFIDAKNGLSKARHADYCIERAVGAASKADDMKEVVSLMNLVLEVDPRASEGHKQRARASAALGDTETAFNDWRASAETGDAIAQFETGKAYLTGTGVVKDRDQGISWLKKSAAQGVPDARRLLANSS